MEKKSGRKRSHAVTCTASSNAPADTNCTTMANIKTELVDDPLKDFFVKFPFDGNTESSEQPSDYYSNPPAPSSDHSLIQSSLEQMWSDIHLIKSQLEKKKAKVSLVDIGEKLDQLINHLMKDSG